MTVRCMSQPMRMLWLASCTLFITIFKHANPTSAFSILGPSVSPTVFGTRAIPGNSHLISLPANELNPYRTTRYSTQRNVASTGRGSSAENDLGVLSDLKVAIVGGGPSGLLLGHGLLQAGATVHIYEKRSRPGKLELEKRAYALGVGLRGRTAIQSVDNKYKNRRQPNQLALWDAVKARGFGSERFILHIGPFSIKLRDENDSDSLTADKLEPSLLLFQSDLCRSLADELDNRWSTSGRLSMKFDCPITSIDLRSKTISMASTDSSSEREAKDNDSFDLIVGCDGVNSIVRNAMIAAFSEFEATQELIPGLLKVVRLQSMPPALDPAAVQLLLPKKGSITCFVEPTSKGRCCLLFAGGRSDPNDILLSKSSTNLTAIEEELMERFPKLIGGDIQETATQLMEQEPSQAAKVVCNTFHASSVAVLIGDAAHATGGVSGQGVNSAFQDSSTLVDCLVESFTFGSTQDHQKDDLISKAMLKYSQKQVPEAKALYDLSFGPEATSPFKRLQLTAKNIVDSIFRGKFGIGERPLNTLLTTSLQNFASIRRSRDNLYGTSFPPQEEWDAIILDIDQKINDNILETPNAPMAPSKPTIAEVKG